MGFANTESPQFEAIIILVDKLINQLEQSQRVKDVFLLSEKDKQDYLKKLTDYRFSFSDIFYELRETLSRVISFDSIEIIISDKRETSLNGVVNTSRELAFHLSLFESDNHSDLISQASNFNEIWKFVYLKCLLLLYYCSSSFEYDYSEENLELVKQHVIGNVYYRGHSDSSYKIIPSMIRSLNKTQLINYFVIENMYRKSGLLNKFKTHVDSSASVNYEFCSFIQHATSYSPLIDFTKNKDIALSFATHPTGNLNVYNATDASLIMLAIRNNDPEIDIRNINIDYHASKLKIDSLIYGKPFYRCTVNDFDASFGLSTIATNDRMRYQSGVFFCFYRCVIVKGIPLIPLSKGYLVTFNITHIDKNLLGLKSKKAIYNDIISSNPEYDYNHLMNPYDYFGEYNK